MLNEFIVWDDEDRKFITLENFWKLESLDEDATRNEKTAEMLNFYYGCETFNYIGKTDIDGKKIYDDSSIVEFEYFYGGNWVKMSGYFQYHLDELRQEVHLLESPNKSFWSVLSYDITKFQNFKIIDTLQENKLGLCGD